ncbi:hypothetical protein BDN70DRAFT_884255 [Pholiota conissans]|uniref:F-box domain-containing protein n=1 Tax=Pholiota conissans TaxID=109636 RepID=A0A9P5YSF4_9AGAR|nr:hypothetical protein BDN70DRAFT_884255 [Pholiota conissans]
MSILSLPSTTDDIILDDLSASELFKYGRTCKTIHAIVQSYIPRKFQVHKLLARYFTQEEIDHFRYLQAITGMLISGSTALQFFDRVEYPDSDLDLYLEHGYREEVGRWLLDIGYKYVARATSATGRRRTFQNDLSLEPDSTPERMLTQRQFIETGNGYLEDAQCVFSFEKDNPYRKVQMITSINSPLERILYFHSTCVMNIIAHDTAYSFFPRGTFNERRSLICVVASPHNQIGLAKYQKRGWSVELDITRDEFDDSTFSFARGMRYVGDAQCWKLPVFPKIDAQCVSNIEANSWVVWYNEHLRIRMEYSVVKSHRLLTTYLIEQEDTHLQRHLREEIEGSETNVEEGDEEYFLDREFSSIIDWYRKGHYASKTCHYSWPMMR